MIILILFGISHAQDNFRENFCATGALITEYKPPDLFKNAADYVSFVQEYRQTCLVNLGRTSCDRNLGCSGSWNIQGIFQYGCWCNFGSKLLTGQGKPVNIFDEICKDYQLCLRCARIDGKEDGYKCNPKKEMFSAKISSNQTVTCSTNQNTCSSHVCSCNYDFFSRLVVLLWKKKDTYDSSYLHKNGFDVEEICLKKPGNVAKKCCGEYPKRKPFPLNGKYQCCQEKKLYETGSDVCCENGFVSNNGIC